MEVNVTSMGIGFTTPGPPSNAIGYGKQALPPPEEPSMATTSKTPRKTRHHRPRRSPSASQRYARSLNTTHWHPRSSPGPGSSI